MSVASGTIYISSVTVNKGCRGELETSGGQTFCKGFSPAPPFPKIRRDPRLPRSGGFSPLTTDRESRALGGRLEYLAHSRHLRALCCIKVKNAIMVPSAQKAQPRQGRDSARARACRGHGSMRGGVTPCGVCPLLLVSFKFGSIISTMQDYLPRLRHSTIYGPCFLLPLPVGLAMSRKAAFLIFNQGEYSQMSTVDPWKPRPDTPERSSAPPWSPGTSSPQAPWTRRARQKSVPSSPTASFPSPRPPSWPMPNWRLITWKTSGPSRPRGSG